MYNWITSCSGPTVILQKYQIHVTHFVLDLRPLEAGDLAQPLDNRHWPRPGDNTLEADLMTQHHRGLGASYGYSQGSQHKVKLHRGVSGENQLSVTSLAGDHLVIIIIIITIINTGSFRSPSYEVPPPHMRNLTLI